MFADDRVQGVAQPLHLASLVIEFGCADLTQRSGDADLAFIVLQVVQRLGPAVTQAVLAG
ncbi:hypothetical protein D3C76_1141430 [compost metagenome]